MTDQVLLYISAATDLEIERDLLGRIITEIPIDLGWRIAQSPRKSDPLDIEAVTNADVHILLFGGDIRAPVGLEWMTARRAGRRPTLFLKQAVQRTQAALSFIQFVEGDSTWNSFKNSADLRFSVLTILANYIRKMASIYGLSPTELNRLQTWRDELEEPPGDIHQELRGGTGESSLIFSKERFTPSGGILIKADENGDQDLD